MTPRTDSNTLRECPFCGGEASANGVLTHGKNHNAWWPDGTRIATSYFVNCPKCGADNKGLFGHQSRNEAIAAWNTRADSPDLIALRKERDALRKALFEALNEGLIYWEPNTSRGHERKSDMIDRFEELLLNGVKP